jgi:hypothetical protein
MRHVMERANSLSGHGGVPTRPLQLCNCAERGARLVITRLSFALRSPARGWLDLGFHRTLLRPAQSSVFAS